MIMGEKNLTAKLGSSCIGYSLGNMRGYSLATPGYSLGKPEYSKTGTKNYSSGLNDNRSYDSFKNTVRYGVSMSKKLLSYFDKFGVKERLKLYRKKCPACGGILSSYSFN
jgi:hypothetical protein